MALNEFFFPPNMSEKPRTLIWGIHATSHNSSLYEVGG